MAKHVSDPYVRRSVKENYRARSAFKLIEMNEKHRFIHAGHTVIDMGAAPGAWSQVLVKQVNARIQQRKKCSDNENELIHPSEITSLHKPNPDMKCGVVIALDRAPIFAMPGVHIIDDWNLTDDTISRCNQRLQNLLHRLNIQQVDGILSDMCPNVTGCADIDQQGRQRCSYNFVLCCFTNKFMLTYCFLAIATLQLNALRFARQLLKPNGYFLCKLFHSRQASDEIRNSLKSLFRIVHSIKPSSSREESPEMYLLAMQYYGTTVNSSLDSNWNDQTRVETNPTEIERLLAEARRVRTTHKKAKG
jgi:23S rRNA (uridine2552-2'-O)-methyltransferase